ncbi:MAG: phosphoglycerate dehydrogenase [Aggregatilineales bacterium]
MAYHVLVTARSFGNAPGPHFDYLQQNDCLVDLRAKSHPLGASELGEIIGSYEGAILGLDICDASVIARADKLHAISRYGSGVDQVDLDAASKRGIVVTNTPGANRTAVAELCIGLLFSLARNLPQVAAATRAGVWKRTPGWELNGKTLGVIGLGQIGRQVGALAAALGMRVLGYDPLLSTPVPGVQLVDLITLLGAVDVVSLHCALTPETENLINADRIAAMRDGAYLINTARGALIDEAALYEALKTGKVAGAAADVFREDPPTGCPLLLLNNFIATPHLGATTRESIVRMSMMAAQNVVAILRGEPCEYIVNGAALGA